jgi:uncharacterized protein (DUF2147 family)
MSVLSSACCQNKADRLCGLYFAADPDNGNGSQIQIYKTKQNTYEAKVVWMEHPNHPNGEPIRDVHNPDPAKRNQTNVGLVFMRNFTYNPDNDQWINGTVYDARSGKSYKGNIQFESENKLRVRGYFGISVLGKTVVWTKESTPRNQKTSNSSSPK